MPNKFMFSGENKWKGDRTDGHEGGRKGASEQVRDKRRRNSDEGGLREMGVDKE